MSSEMRELVKDLLRTEMTQWSHAFARDKEIAQLALTTFCAKLDATLLARTEAGADGAKPFGWWIECHGTDGDFGQFVTDRAFVDLLRSHGVVERETALYAHPQDASGDAAPVLFGRDSGGDWYVDTDTKSICVDVDFDPARQLSLILKQDGRVAWSIFVQEPDSSTTKATGPSVMNLGFYEALSYIAMQAKEAK